MIGHGVAIALYTFREAVRNKILYSILFFAIALMGLGLAIGPASLDQDTRILVDVGLFALWFFSNVVAIFVGVTMVFMELERKTVYTVLSKPVHRPVYFVGKFVGVGTLLLVQVAFMATTLTTLMAVRGDPVPSALFAAYWLILMESLIVAAVALFFSSFSTPYVSGFLTLGLWVVARLIPELQAFLPELVEDGTGPVLIGILTTVVNVWPDMTYFTVTTQVTYGLGVPFEYVWNATLYAAGYLLILLSTGSWIFQRRDFI